MRGFNVFKMFWLIYWRNLELSKIGVCGEVEGLTTVIIYKMKTSFFIHHLNEKYTKLTMIINIFNLNPTMIIQLYLKKKI